MRKKSLNGKRVMAFALAFSLVLGEASAVVAAPADAETVVSEEECPVDMDIAQTSISENDGAEDNGGETDPVESEETEAEAAEDMEADQALDGSLSKVIGVKTAEQDSEYFYDENYTKRGYYTSFRSQPGISVPGKLTQDAASGLIAYAGHYYGYAAYDAATNRTTLYPNYEKIIVDGNSDAYKDAATGLYTVGGRYYISMSTYQSEDGAQHSYYCPYDEAIVAGQFQSEAEFNQQCGRYTKSDAYYADGNKYAMTPTYYEINGRSFSYRVKAGNIYYCMVSSEIFPNTSYVKFEWNPLAEPVKKTAAGQQMEVGYELEVNGQIYVGDIDAYDAAGNAHTILEAASYEYQKRMADGESVTIRVRGVYYHEENKVGTWEDGTQVGTNVYVIDATGAWSEPTGYTKQPLKTIPAVTGLKAEYQEQEYVSGYTHSLRDTASLSWQAVPQAGNYYVYKIYAKQALPDITTANFASYYYLSSSKKNSLGIKTSSTFVSGSTYLEDSLSNGYTYCYFAVVPSAATGAEYINTQSLGTIAEITSVSAPQKENLPQVTHLRIERTADGSQKLVWDPVKKNVVIYAYTAPQFPAYYNYSLQNPVRNDGNRDYHLYNDLSAAEKRAADEVYSATVTSNGNYVESASLPSGLTAGKTYYFVAYTYDPNKRNQNQIPVTYTKEVKTKNVYGVESASQETYSYYTYTPFSAPSNMVSTRKLLTKPTVYTYVTKNSVKLTMPTTWKITGYEIYRKAGKKFKKIATTTADEYTDTGLKANTSYTYKVRAYSYDLDTKLKSVSEYAIETIKTADAANISMKAVKASKTSVKLSWTKVSGATRYEIYRTNSLNADRKTYSTKYDAAGYKTYLRNERYELVKTLSKRKKSYTDKKLTEGETYKYVVMAYYKTGNKIEYVSDAESVTLELSSIKNLKAVLNGSNVKITWDKDTYATGYELEYTIYNADDSLKQVKPEKRTGKGTSCTISLATGEYVRFRARAVGKNNTYSSWTSVQEARDLAPVKGIKVAVVSKKNADGKQQTGIKVTWKPVAGAKYYKVYRSKVEGAYDKDVKLYDLANGRELIAKETNDNFYDRSTAGGFDGKRTDNNAYYEEYNEVSGSVTGTSAVDYADLPAGVTYYYTVVAYGEIPNAGKDSPVSSVQTSKAAKIVAGGLSSISVKNTKKGKVTVTFNAVEGAKKYTIYRATKKNGKYTKVATVKVTKKNKNKKSLSYTGKAVKKKTYYYKVVAEGTNALKADMDIESATLKIKVKK